MNREQIKMILLENGIDVEKQTIDELDSLQYINLFLCIEEQINGKLPEEFFLENSFTDFNELLDELHKLIEDR